MVLAQAPARSATPAAAAGQPAADSTAGLKARGRRFSAAFDNTVRMAAPSAKGFNPKVEHDLLMAFHGHGSDRRQYALQVARRVPGSPRRGRQAPDDFRLARLPRTGWSDGAAAEADTVQLIGLLKHRYKVGKIFSSAARWVGHPC